MLAKRPYRVNVAAAEKKESKSHVEKPKAKEITARDFMSEGFRRSARSQTVIASKIIRSKLEEERERRASFTPIKKVQEIPKTQQERLEEAVLTEQRNVSSLSQIFEAEETRRERQKMALQKVRIVEPMFSILSTTRTARNVDKGLNKRPLQILPDSKPNMKKSRTETVELDSKDAATIKIEDQKEILMQEASSISQISQVTEANTLLAPNAYDFSADDQIHTNENINQEMNGTTKEMDINIDMCAEDKAVELIVSEIIDDTEKHMEEYDLPSPQKRLEEAFSVAHNSIVEMNGVTTNEFEYLIEDQEQVSDDEIGNGTLYERLFVRLVNFADGTLDDQEDLKKILFGDQVQQHQQQHEKYQHPQSKKGTKTKYLKQKLCAITGKNARYMDPYTGVCYHDMNAFKILRKLANNEFKWSENFGCYSGILEPVQSVPKGFLDNCNYS